MLSDSQSAAHRVQPPTRSKPRWQPYPCSSSLGSILATCEIHTPKPSLPSSPLPSATFHPISNNPLHLLKESTPRDNGKQKYALGLIDQAVKTLFEIWRPEDIPCVFVGPAKGQTPLCNPPASVSQPQPLVSTGAEMDSALLPLKNFVHEVLKRSRTSGSIMQTALCYLEAVRPKVPEILHDERLGVRAYFMPESAILPATETELQLDRKLSNLEGSDPSTSDELVKTVRLIDEDTDDVSDHCEMSSVIPVTVMHTTSPLPSPLLCPRRTFLAALILASKFSQDKCYSNRAWAKLSGLPPREIGRCERALGQALDWRLWVGKKALASAPAVYSRAVVRTQSESCITVLPSLREPFLHPSVTKASEPPNLEASSSSTAGKGLRRCSTAPMESFRRLPLTRSDTIVNHEDNHKEMEMSWIQTPYASSDSSSSSSSTLSPETPPLSSSPSTSGGRTIQLPCEDGMFPSYTAPQPRLDLDDAQLISSVYSDSPPSFLPDTTVPKLCCSNPVQTPLTESKLAAMQFQMSLAESISESLWSSRLRMVTGPHLWHADGGHLSLESAPVH